MYVVRFTKSALKQLKKLEKPTSAMIVGWVRKNLENCENPRHKGKALTTNHSGQWRYRVGDYRLIAEIIDQEVLILLVNIGRRRDIYKK